MNDELPELEAPCQKCAGRGGVSDIEEWYECQTCGGSGFVPTEIGARILSLVRHNSKLRISAELEVAGK